MLPSARTLRRHWKLTSIAIFSLSIAMALGIAALSISNTLLVLPPSAPDPDRLITLYSRSQINSIEHISYPDYQYLRLHNHVFTDIAAAPNSIGVNADFNFAGREISVMSRPVSENYFAVLGLQPFLGRFFTPGEDQRADRIAVMTWACWQRLGADPHIVGKVIAKTTIIGVAPSQFTGGFYGMDGDLFTPLGSFDSSPWRTERSARRLVLTGRLRPDVTLAQAQSEVSVLADQLASAFPREDKDHSLVVTRATLLPPDALPNARLMTAILMSLVLLVLLIACANVANLLLALAVGRRQESAIKLALGAPRGRLIREMLAEGALLCAAGGLLGYVMVDTAIARFSRFTVVFPTAGSFSFGLRLRLDFTVLAFTLLLVAIAVLATGLAPAIYASSPALAQIISGEISVGGTRKQARRNVLVVVQVAICTLVLVGMGLCQRNLYNLRHVDLGFYARNLVANSIYLEAEGYDEIRGRALCETLRQRLAALPGVESVTIAWDLPLMGASHVPVRVPDGTKTFSIARTVVDADYFRTLALPMRAGRSFDSSDRQGTAPVVIVNRRLANLFWPRQDPIGKSIEAGEPARKFTVVGVAADGKYLDLDEDAMPFIYYPFSQHYRGGVNVIARTNGDPRLWIGPLARALRGLGLNILIAPVTLDSWMTLTLLGQRVVTAGVAALSALGLLLAVIGLSGVISYSISERKKELGIRVALGARPWQLLRMVVLETLWVTGAGVAIGSLLGVGATSIFRSQLFGISPVEWTVLLPVGAAMLALSLLVASAAARPWLAIDPMQVVRHT